LRAITGDDPPIVLARDRDAGGVSGCSKNDPIATSSASAIRISVEIGGLVAPFSILDSAPLVSSAP